jgi:replicative DNA helicase
MLKGNIPPNAEDLEKAVLGALMLEKHAIHTVSGILSLDSFYSPKHQKIYEAILSLYKDGEPIDLLTVTEKLRKLGSLDNAGGAVYITELTTYVNSAANIESHCRIIVENYLKRRMIELSQETIKAGYDPTIDAFDLSKKLFKGVQDAIQDNTKSSIFSTKTLAADEYQQIELARKQKVALTGVPSGLSDLDRLTSGFKDSNFIVIAGRPSMGKSALVNTIMYNTGSIFQYPIGVFSLEMSKEEIMSRLFSISSEIELEKISHRLNLSDEDMSRVQVAAGKIGDSPIYMDCTGGLTITDVRSRAVLMKMKYDIQLLIIDYLQLMRCDGLTRNQVREREVSEISMSLKQLAKELEIPVIALSQLSRAVETRGGDKRPILSDLRDSGSIEQDADIVIFLYRPEYYGITQDEMGMPTNNLTELIVAKHRNGKLGTIKTKFIGQFTKFTEWTPYQ